MATPMQALQAQAMGRQMGNQVTQAQQARQAMRAPSAPISASAPANANALLAMKNQQVPQIQRTQAPAARLQEIDKIKYQEAAKENLRQQQFAAKAQRYRDDRLFAQEMAKQKQANDDAVALAQRKYDNDLALEKAKVGIALDRKRAEFTLADEKFSNVRGYVNTIFDDFDNWLQGGKQEFIESRTEQLQFEQAFQIEGMDALVQQKYIDDFKANNNGQEPTNALNPSGGLYRKYARQILMNGGYESQLATIDALVNREAEAISQRKAAMYKVASDKVMKLGITTAGANALRPPTESPGSRPKLNNLNAIDTASPDFTPKEKKPVEESNKYLLGSLGGLVVDNVKDLAEWIASDPERAAKYGVAGLGVAAIADELLPPRMSPAKRNQIQADFEADLKARSSVSDKPGKDGKPKRLGGVAQEVKEAKIRPQVMMEHAKKLDPNGLGKKDLAYFEKMNQEDFGKMVRKSRGGLLKKLKDLGIKSIPTKDGKVDLGKIKDNRVVKGGAYITLLLGAIDAVTYLASDDDPKKAEKNKEELIGQLDAQIDAEKAVLQLKADRLAELEAKEGNQSGLRNPDLDRVLQLKKDREDHLNRFQGAVNNYTGNDPRVLEANQRGLSELQSRVDNVTPLINDARANPPMRPIPDRTTLGRLYQLAMQNGIPRDEFERELVTTQKYPIATLDLLEEIYPR